MEEVKKKKKNKGFNNKASWQQVISSKAGQEVLKDIISFSGLYRNSYCKGDPNQTIFNCGLQSVSQYIIASCETVNATDTKELLTNIDNYGRG